MSDIKEIKIPQVGESISEVAIGALMVNVGDMVIEDQIICEIETEKVSLEVNSTVSGIVQELFVKSGDVKNVDDVIAVIKIADVDNIKKENKQNEKDKDNGINVDYGNKINNVEQINNDANDGVNFENETQDISIKTQDSQKIVKNDDDGKRVVKMSPLRKKIASHLVNAQHEGALLSTFNEVDMSNILNIRKKHNDYILQTTGEKLSIVSFFVFASARAMRKFKIINAQVEQDNIVYYENVNIGVAVSTKHGLVVPVIKDCANKSLYEINDEVVRLSKLARDEKLLPSDMVGGTFTISNGGVFGSLLSTPIVNSPQSAIMGMHNITKRAVVVDDEIVIREMMFVALSYDHRIIDGKDSVSYLSLVKKYLENPDLLLLDN